MNQISVKYKIAMVSYLNSKPFEFGLKNYKHSSLFDVMTSDPATCAKWFEEDNVDISLIPVGALHDNLKEYNIISDFCIGCDGEVRTVGLYSNVRLENGKRLIADHHSRTSVLLSLYLLKKIYHIDIPIMTVNLDHFKIEQDDIVLMIGDKVFKKENEFLFRCDLGDLWKKHTNLPFVFAVWVSKKALPNDVVQKLNESFTFGMNNIDTIIQQESSENLDLYYYFKQNISYHLDTDKKRALKMFLEVTKPIHKILVQPVQNI